MLRVLVVGTSGSGKSTFTRRLGERVHIPHHELDAWHWLPDWTEQEPERFRSQVAEFVNGDSWVLDGNYLSKCQDLTWPRATHIVWLDRSFWTCMARITRRTLTRMLWRTPLWNGNREPFWRLFTQDSMLYWTWTTWAKNRHRYTELLRAGEPAQAQWWVCRSDSDCQLALDYFTRKLACSSARLELPTNTSNSPASTNHFKLRS